MAILVPRAVAAALDALGGRPEFASRGRLRKSAIQFERRQRPAGRRELGALLLTEETAYPPRLTSVALHREIDGADPLRPQPIERLSGRHERRRGESVHLATGTLACPGCDAPVLPGPGRTLVGDPFSCAFCGHAAAVRDFLSLAEPTRPTRVAVRVRGLALR